MSDYKFYFAQLAGEKPETTPGNPQAGFYRRSYHASTGEKRREKRWEAIAIWYEDGSPVCERQAFDGSRMKPDEIDELFSQCCRDAIPEDVYRTVADGGAWPDHVAERVGPDERQTALYAETAGEKLVRTEPERESPAGIGDNSGELAPFEIMRERVIDVHAQVKKWLDEIGGTIKTQGQADKAANFADLFAEIEKEATAAHKIEKEPILKRGREIDGSWKPVIELADASKRKAKGMLTPFLIEQKRLADEAARKENERLADEARKAREAQEEAAKLGYGAAPAPVAPPPTVAPAQVKAGTRGRVSALRTVKRAQIDDLPAIAAYLATLDNPDFVEVCTKIAYRILAAGSPVPGATLISEQVAA